MRKKKPKLHTEKEKKKFFPFCVPSCWIEGGICLLLAISSKVQMEKKLVREAFKNLEHPFPFFTGCYLVDMDEVSNLHR